MVSHPPTDNNPLLSAWRDQLLRARTNPFLFQLLLKQFQRVLKRLAYFYAQLASLPRRKRRALQRALATSLIGAAMLLALSSAPVVHAASITVSGTCTLDEAITNANDDAATFPDCAAGSGADTIYLTANITLAATLPSITSEITLEGNNFYVDGAGAFRVFFVTNTGDFTINATTIQNGNYAGSGGAIRNEGTLTLTNSTFSGNSAGYHGGAIDNATYATLTITNSTLSGNTAGDGGGAIYNHYYANVTITNSTLSGNTATGNGGAIDNDGTCTITNSTFSGNSAGYYGGAIDNATYATLTITNSTLSGNTATEEGGAINSHLYGTTNLNRSLISGNTAASGDEIYNESGGTVNANNYNLFGNNDAGKTNADAFSGFTPGANDITATSDGTLPTALASILDTTLADNGSTIMTPTGVVQTLALLSGSPALDKAPNADCSAAVGPPLFGAGGLDQRAFPRNVDFVPPPTANDCDIGAFELQNTTAVNIAGFRAVAKDEKNVLKWRTMTEAQIAGFNVYRKVGKQRWNQINAQFKQAKNPGDAQGNRYAFRDKKIKAGTVYRYKVEVKYLDGHTEWTEIVRVKTP